MIARGRNTRLAGFDHDANKNTDRTGEPRVLDHRISDVGGNGIRRWSLRL